MHSRHRADTGAVTVLLRQVQLVIDELLGRGLPVPAEALRRARFRPDPPWSWCPRCGASRVASARGGRAGPTAPEELSVEAPCCAPDAASPDCVVRLGSHGGALRRWVVDVKHSGWEPMAELLGAMLARQVVACGVAAPGEEGVVVVPVPTPFLRARARGIAHAEALARALARRGSWRSLEPLRQRHAGSQVRADGRASRRARDVRFVVRRRGAGSRLAVAGAHVVLVDDVRTTGSTLREASELLRQLGAARVSAAVLSVRDGFR